MAESVFEASQWDSLYPYQQEKLHREYLDYLNRNKESGKYVHDKCPKCGSDDPCFTKSGFSNSGKQMVRCHKCGKRIVVDHGQLTYYSHQDQSKWDQLIEDTFTLVPEMETAAKLDVSPYTAWRMRMKLLHALESIVSDTVIADEVEMDEKYVMNSHKGQEVEGVKPRHRGEAASKPGLSNEKICIATGIQRLGPSVLMATNTGNPSSEDLLKLSSHLAENSLVWVDGKTSYNALLKEKNCEARVVGDHKTYTSVDHLNNVNSFHSMIDGWYRKYRGVASKYLNRYCSLFTLIREYMGCDIQEILLGIKTRLRAIKDFFYIRQMRTEDLFIY